MHRTLNNFGRIASLLALGSAALVAQGTQTSNISGEVVDKGGIAVVGATVRLTSPSLQGQRVVTTDAKGRFIARLLPPGVYGIEINKEGFSSIKVSQTLGIDQNFQPRFVMNTTQGAIVEVVGAPPAVDKTDVKTATNYSLDNVDKLPNGRSMENVALLTPGVTAGVGGRVQIRGAMTSGNLYLVDGQNVADNAYQNRGVRIIEDAVEETQVITGAISAEYGNVDGGVMNSITRSGSNQFTGQIRYELSNEKWNATRPRTSDAGRAIIPDKLNKTLTYSVGGFILKDKLWFYAAYFGVNTDNTGNISSNSLAPAAGEQYATAQKEIRRTVKLTYLVTQEHTLVGSFSNSTTNDVNRNYSAGEVRALVPQVSTSEFYNVALRSIWSSNLTTDIRYGAKKQNLSAGGSGSESPLYNYNTGLYYNNGIFSSTDGGDNRENKTFNIKASIFWDALGSHQTDTGFDYYEGIRRAKNEQSPTNLIFGVQNMNLAARTAEGVDIWVYQSTDGQAKNSSTGLYVNDKWSLNKNLSIQLGLRFDKYEAKNETGTKTAGANGTSPRLGVKYDLFGDSKWVFGASWARYNGKVLEGITNQVTGQGNPIETDYNYIGPAGQQTFAFLQQKANYDITPAGIAYYGNPAVNVKLNDAMKAPNTTESQVSAAYTYNSEMLGQGFFRMTYVAKKWSDIIDYSVGTEGLSAPVPTGERYYVRVWNNSPLAERKYNGLEADFSWAKGKWSAMGNITWSQLKGNYEGEGTNTPSRGEGLNAWNIVNLYSGYPNYTLTQSNVEMFDRNWMAPYGYLAGHNPLVMRFTANYTTETFLGKTSVGWVFRFNSGLHYSDTRSITRARVNALIPAEAGSSFTQYKDQKRGAGVFNATVYHDLAVTQDFNIVKIQERPVAAFVKLVLGNVFNHQQQINWNTTSSAATGAASTGLTSAWVYPAAYGTSPSSSNFALPRQITMSVGVRY